MLYRPYGTQGYEVSAFGMGCMRLPKKPDENGNMVVDREEGIRMIRYAVEHGVTYFDSAHVYLEQECDAILGEALSGGYREKVKIVTKIPPLMVNSEQDFFDILDVQLKKLQTDCIDALLIHSLNREKFEHVKKVGMIQMMEKAKAQGKIAAIGMSFHDDFDTFKEIIDFYPWAMCNIQMNILDHDQQATLEGMRYAHNKGVAVCIMEPLRGGGLAVPPEPVQKLYDAFPTKRSGVEWAFRYMYNFPEVTTILSGVSSMEQLQDNLRIFENPVAGCMDEAEQQLIQQAREAYKSLIAVPCTGCRYCMPCPQGVDIPGIFAAYNDGTMYGSFEAPKGKYARMVNVKHCDASLCVECGACEAQCPQAIGIIEQLKQARAALE